VAVDDGEVRTQEGHGKFVKREPFQAVNTALSTWKELTAPRKVERTGIPASRSSRPRSRPDLPDPTARCRRCAT
jgi:hypothetical protein